MLSINKYRVTASDQKMLVYTQSLLMRWQNFWDFFTAYVIREKKFTKEMLFSNRTGGEVFLNLGKGNILSALNTNLR